MRGIQVRATRTKHLINFIPCFIYDVIQHDELLIIITTHPTGHKVARGIEAARVAQREQPVPRRAPDRPPQVDDWEAAGEQRGHVRGGEVPTYAGGGGVGGLVDAYLVHGLALLCGALSGSPVRQWRITGVADREGTGEGRGRASGCLEWSEEGERGGGLTVVEGHNARRARDALGVVLALDRCIVVERGVSRPVEVLEAGRVERDAILLPEEVIDLCGVCNGVPVALGARRVNVSRVGECQGTRSKTEPWTKLDERVLTCAQRGSLSAYATVQLSHAASYGLQSLARRADCL